MRNIRLVLDTNVVVSALLNGFGYERYTLDLAFNRKVQIAVSDAILSEYEDVLRRPKLRLTPKLVTRSLRDLRLVARIVHPHRELKISADPGDNRFLECAETARADYLVTGNKRHFPSSWGQTLIVNARELLEWIVPVLRR